jgi:opacity protein-like surface antigen
MTKSQFIESVSMILLFVCLVSPDNSVAQGLATPLTMQGLDNMQNSSVVSRSMGGLVFSLRNDATAMFSNPASLRTLNGLQVSVAGLQQYTDVSQTQQWYPQKYYPGLSLLMEGLTNLISNPDPAKPGVVFRNAGDTVQRPFDQIPPNWAQTAGKALPLQAFAAMPFSIGEYKLSAGIGFVQYANLNAHYQNNNVLAPEIGSQRPTPIILPPASDSVHAYWYQYQQSRDGSINGYGAAISADVVEGLSIGFSGMLLNGSTDDNEQEVGRGSLFFVYTPQNYFAVDSVYSHVSRTGTSDFSGEEFTVSAVYRGRFVTLGAAVKPPTTITRKYQTHIVVDSMGQHSDQSVNGQDEMTLPWRGTIGFAVAVRENLTIGFEYEIRSYASAVYKNAAGMESNPWLSASLMHVGAEYTPTPWLSLRAGAREQAAAFQEAGAPIVDEPISYTVYSAGVGVSFDAFRFNLAYEYSDMKYQDMWATNVNFNRQTTNSVIAGISYELP